MHPGSVLEHVLLSIVPGREAEFEEAARGALPIIEAQPGCLGARFARFVERPTAYALLVERTSLDAHQAFRDSGDPYDRWRAALHRFYDPFPAVEHLVPL